MPAAVADQLAHDARVAYVQPDGKVRATAQTTPTGINRANADASPTARIDGVDQRVDVDVAVIDTGVDLDHPDLDVNRAKAKNCALALSADDDNGHGSHVWTDVDDTFADYSNHGAEVDPVKERLLDVSTF